mmetsp:Transcript_13105/g.38062  ORF Transcript_13105/g.38062 Transcript_13105/m.38062 type:complete len:88 (+) Transcript_13105:392-655(+)
MRRSRSNTDGACSVAEDASPSWSVLLVTIAQDGSATGSTLTADWRVPTGCVGAAVTWLKAAMQHHPRDILMDTRHLIGVQRVVLPAA